MANTDSSKGNGAAKRMANAKRKARMERCWLNGQRRKDKRRAEQRSREEANAMTRRLGVDLTPWEYAKAERKARRALARAGVVDAA